MTAREHFQAGRLADAIADATQDVKKNPTDVDRRSLLVELFCFAGDIERADMHLDTMVDQDPELEVPLSLVRQLLRAEQHRRDLFTSGRVPEVAGPTTVEMKHRLEVLVHLRAEDHAAAVEAVRQADESHVAVTGERNGTAFNGLRDLDDVLGGMLEVFTSTGKYFWVPLEHVIALELRPPQRMLDLLWRQVHLAVNEGPEGEVYMPVVYPLSHEAEEEALRLGRATDWRDDGGVMRGVGQKMYLVGEEDVPLMELGDLTLTTATSTTESSD